MSSIETPKVWWTYEHAPTRKAVVASSVVAWFFAVFFLYTDVVKILASRPWWEDFIVALTTVAVPVLALLEVRHSAEANRLRDEANGQRRRANDLSEENAELAAALDAERNKHLAQIAINTARATTPSERNAEILHRHIGACVSVTEGEGAVKGAWPNTPLIVEVNDANIVTLFSPSVGSNPQAWCVQVDCGELEIAEFPQGACPLRLHVRRRYGPNVPLGEITRWEDRNLPAAAPRFNRGGNVYHATFSRPGSAETRSLHVYASADGANSFLLETLAGERVVADNVEISRRFMLFEIDYRAAGFNRSGSGTGGSPHPLFIW
jgi:hypothetical protein